MIVGATVWWLVEGSGACLLFCHARLLLRCALNILRLRLCRWFPFQLQAVGWHCGWLDAFDSVWQHAGILSGHLEDLEATFWVPG